MNAKKTFVPLGAMALSLAVSHMVRADVQGQPFQERAAQATSAFATNDALWSKQWNLHDPQAGINVEAAWQYTRGKGVVIAVVDSGITAHEDLDGKVLPGYDFYSDWTDSRDGDGQDADASDPGDWVAAGECNIQARDSRWIGTIYAGIAAATADNGKGIAGVAPEAKILPVRALGACGGKLVDLADAITWASGGETFGAPINPNPAQVIIVGPGAHGPCPFLLEDAIADARRRGATVVVPAHNESDDVSRINPANCPGVVVVAATNRQGAMASYSSYGRAITLAAPGGTGFTTDLGAYIYATKNAGRMGPTVGNYALSAGTENATAQVAGTVALMHAVSPGISPDRVADYLKRSARPLTRPCTKGCGAGLLDAGGAVRAAIEGE
jgi:serine protease